MGNPIEPSLEAAPDWRLHFAPELEALYRSDREARALPQRIALGLLALLMVVLTPAYDLLTLPPADFNLIARRLQFGVELPAVALALGVALWPRLRRYSEPAILLAATVMSAGVIAQRVLGLQYGFEVPHTFVAVVIAAVAALGSLPFWTLLAWASSVVLAGSAIEIWSASHSGTAIYHAITMVMLLSLLMAGSYTLERTERSNWLDRRRLRELACRDGLTGLSNRRHFDDTLERLLREAARERKTMALLLLDVDHFKSYNDLYGHPAGDEALRRIAAWLAQGVRRPQDFCARLGGEEFAAVWFNPMPPNARWLSEELRKGIGALAIPHAHGVAGVVSASGGLVELAPPMLDRSPQAVAEELMRRADRALYAAKAAGRDQLKVAEPL